MDVEKACVDEIRLELVAGDRRILTLRDMSDNLITSLTKNRASIRASQCPRTFSKKSSQEGWQPPPASLLYGFVLGIEKKFASTRAIRFQAGLTSRTVHRLV